MGDPNAVVAVSNASASAVCAYTTNERDRLYTRRELSSIERTYGSGHRELIAVAQGLDDFGADLAASEATMVYWVTDSANLVSFPTKGSRAGPNYGLRRAKFLAIALTSEGRGLSLMPEVRSSTCSKGGCSMCC